MSPVTDSSSTGHPPSFSSALADSSSPSFGVSPLASVFWDCSPLGGVSLRSDTAGVARFVVFYLFMHYSIMVPSLTAGSEYPSGGGGGVLALRHFVT